MSYEGREIFLCPNGHLYMADCYEFGYSGYDNEDGSKNIKCQICKEKMEFIGSVDDTNGDSCARFYRKTVSKYETIEEKYDPETGIMTRIFKPSRYEIIHAKDDNTWYNFDTGEELKEYAD